MIFNNGNPDFPNNGSTDSPNIKLSTNKRCVDMKYIGLQNISKQYVIVFSRINKFVYVNNARDNVLKAFIVKISDSFAFLINPN